MNRRQLLKVFGGVALGTIVPKVALAKNPLKFPLNSVPDLGTKLDKTRASKVRKVAEYVITRDNQPELISYQLIPKRGKRSYQGAKAIMTFLALMLDRLLLDNSTICILH